MMSLFRNGLLVSGLLFASCSVSQEDDRVVVDETNALGVTALTTHRDWDNTFVLEAFAGTEQRASVRMRQLASIAELNNNPGTEIVVTIGEHVTRMVTEEPEVFRLEAAQADRDGFLELAAVKSTLEREANIVVMPVPKAPSGDRAYWSYANQCAPADLLTSPVAKQCCSSWAEYWGGDETMIFVNPSNAVVYRYKSQWGFTCASNTGGSCSGTACYYGPNGYTRATLYTGSGYPHVGVTGVWNNSDYEVYCSHSFSSYQLTPQFGNVTGTYPTGVGCPGGGSGPVWDYY